jgi:hypothetical protein
MKADLSSASEKLSCREARLDTANQNQTTHRPSAGEPLGRTITVSGSKAAIGLLTPGQNTTDAARVTIGTFLGVHTPNSLIIGAITEIKFEAARASQQQDFHAIAHLDLLGEIKPDKSGKPRFHRGLTEYPTIGDPVMQVSHDELLLIYDSSGASTITIGSLQQDSSIDAYINASNMLSKHFAILGTTGVGKSSGVAIILEEVLKLQTQLRIFLIDPHNEYAQFFTDRAYVLSPHNLKLPFWMFSFDELVDIIFGARPGIDEELDILSELIVMAKNTYAANSSSHDKLSSKKHNPKNSRFTADTPVPYRLTDLISLLDERMGKLENRSSSMKYSRLIARIETIRNDPRYAFMFENANVGGDTMAEVLGQMFRLPPNGKPMTIMQLAGFPAEVTDAVMSVVCRMAFDFGVWSDGVYPLLFVCEEAHRYAAADLKVGFGPTRRSISRIATEGRKYNVFLGLVSQRPAELDATILSQCSTLFAMRMANDRDQALLRSAASDAAANLLAFVPSLGTREVFVFGEGVALPTRLKFRELPDHLLPKDVLTYGTHVAPMDAVDEYRINAVVERWRGGDQGARAKSDDFGPELSSPLLHHQAPSLQPAPTLDPDRYKLLKQPLPEAHQSAGGLRKDAGGVAFRPIK